VAFATAEMLWADTIFWHGIWKRKLLAWYLCIVMCAASLRPVVMLSQICAVCCSKLQKHFEAIMEVF